MKVKICGITNLHDAQAACEAGADAVGFVLAPEAKKRNRYISFEEAAEIIAKLPPFVTTVAVCVNEPLGALARYLTCFDLVQLHGDEDPAEMPPRHVAIKAFRVGIGFDLAELDRYEARAFLLDAAVPGESGGTGTLADWTAAQQAVDAGKTVVLAGGLTPENVVEAVQTVRPFAVDVSGGVEAEPGKKDHERIRTFIRAAKSSLA